MTMLFACTGTMNLARAVVGRDSVLDRRSPLPLFLAGAGRESARRLAQSKTWGPTRQRLGVRREATDLYPKNKRLDIRAELRHLQRVDRSATSLRTLGEPGSAGAVKPAFPRPKSCIAS